jgi:hypothetical protein
MRTILASLPAMPASHRHRSFVLLALAAAVVPLAAARSQATIVFTDVLAGRGETPPSDAVPVRTASEGSNRLDAPDQPHIVYMDGIAGRKRSNPRGRRERMRLFKKFTLTSWQAVAEPTSA